MTYKAIPLKIVTTLIFTVLSIVLLIKPSSEATGFKEVIIRECHRSSIPVYIMTNLIKAESSGNPYAIGKRIKINHKGIEVYTNALGLCQIIPEFHYSGERQDLFKPEINIRIGCKVLKNCLRRSKWNWRKALAYYNGQVLNKNEKYINKILGGKI